MARIFISYAKQDTRSQATELFNLLNAIDGLTAWMDESLEADSSWAYQIQLEIDAADYVVVLLSPDVNRDVLGEKGRSFVLNEIDYARQEKKPILPVMVYRTKIPVQLAGIQHIDLTDTPEDLTKVIKRIKRRFKMDTLEDHSLPPQIDKVSEEPESPITRLLRYSGATLWMILLGIPILFIMSQMPMFNSGLNDATPTVIAQDPTATDTVLPTLTDTAIPTVTETPTPTQELPIADVVATLDAQATEAQATANAVSTAAARATAYAQATQDIIDATATATLWTNTPTPNITASIEAYRTEQAQTATQAWVDSWTATPTNTHTPTNTFTPTATATPTPNVTATIIAFRPQTNADWTPVEQDFDGVTMVLVPAGCFDMGENGEGGRQCFDEPFWIDKYEVTQGQFARLGGEKADNNHFSGNERPVERITWFEARDFCGLRASRLSTEAEWEYAARGPNNLVYPWGNRFIADNAVYRNNSSAQTAFIGSRLGGRSWVGALDMSGNVMEWTSSLYESYPYDGTDGREVNTGSRTDVRRVLRGGSWNNVNNKFLLATTRYRNDPSSRYSFVGFRCMRDYE